eukprot:TRINITY_DN4131_c0_g1_i2.p1 TRINITY_DN4131_c0_g1~~TRINITY_DN4131_c0_g1_i2.p1  ORF type:complete len:280 (+),score=44.05 TRINITY_DN4131_c0_g1_i2:852-1691(+)
MNPFLYLKNFFSVQDDDYRLGLRQLRKLDRVANWERWPRLFYPELYLLDGGYSNFFSKFRSYCVPQEYVSMFDTRFTMDCRASLNELKVAKSKLSCSAPIPVRSSYDNGCESSYSEEDTSDTEFGDVEPVYEVVSDTSLAEVSEDEESIEDSGIARKFTSSPPSNAIAPRPVSFSRLNYFNKFKSMSQPDLFRVFHPPEQQISPSSSTDFAQTTIPLQERTQNSAFQPVVNVDMLVENCVQTTNTTSVDVAHQQMRLSRNPMRFKSQSARQLDFSSNML